MLDQAALKGAYTELTQLKLGQEEFYDTYPIPYRNRFDVVTASGLMNNNYMDENIL